MYPNLLNDNIPIEAKVRVNGILYNQLEPSNNLKEGDLVLDTKDWTYGYIDTVIGDRVSVRENFASELNIPMTRLRKLIPSLENNSLS